MKTIEQINYVSSKFSDQIWLCIGDEHSDPIIDSVFSRTTTSATALVAFQGNSFAIVNEMEVQNVAKILSSEKQVEIIKYDGHREFFEILGNVLIQFVQDREKRIALNYSDDAECDFLRYGMFLRLKAKLDDLGFGSRIVSADALIKALYESKSERDIYRLRLAARRSLEIILKGFALVREGDAETDIQKYFWQQVGELPAWLREEEAIMEEFAWTKSLCPVILAGDNLAKGAHSEPSDYALRRGDTLYCDFGVQVHFADGERWSGDLQRMGYLPGSSESRETADFRFKVLYESISSAAKVIYAGAPVGLVDEAARSTITNAGFPDYVHATGHAIGESAHGIGATIKPENQNGEHLALHGTYTIEPRIKIANGGSVEEMVVVREQSAEFLSDRQKSLIIVG